MGIYHKICGVFVMYILTMYLGVGECGITESNRNSCQGYLDDHIPLCLVSFEAMWGISHNQVQGNEGQDIAKLCRLYRESLQCLAIALQQCAPADRHFTMIATRIGHLRMSMEILCSGGVVRTTYVTPTPTTPQSTSSTITSKAASHIATVTESESPIRTEEYKASTVNTRIREMLSVEQRYPLEPTQTPTQYRLDQPAKDTSNNENNKCGPERNCVEIIEHHNGLYKHHDVQKFSAEINAGGTSEMSISKRTLLFLVLVLNLL